MSITASMSLNQRHLKFLENNAAQFRHVASEAETDGNAAFAKLIGNLANQQESAAKKLRAKIGAFETSALAKAVEG